MSPDLLLIIYYEVASKYMFHDLVANELKVYLMKFTDKIIHICKGSILLNQELLTNVVRLMLITPAGQSAVNSKQKNKSPDLSSRQDEMLTKMSQTLWQTFKTELFVNYSLKGNRILIQWINLQLSQLAEGTGQQLSATVSLKPAESQRLFVLFDLIELILENNCSKDDSESCLYAL